MLNVNFNQSFGGKLVKEYVLISTSKDKKNIANQIPEECAASSTLLSTLVMFNGLLS